MDEHFACPKCGYDLHGLPKGRCPECGFQFDFAALRSIAMSEEVLRIASARTLVVREAIVIALLLPVLGEQRGFPTAALLLAGVAGYICAFVVWTVLTDAYRGMSTLPSLLTNFVALALGFGFIVRLGVGPIAAAIVLVSSWLIRLTEWPSLPPATNMGDAEFHRSVVRMSHWANGLLGVASLFQIYVLVA